jgi:transglutaminase-like putative cysteine protease
MAASRQLAARAARALGAAALFAAVALLASTAALAQRVPLYVLDLTVTAAEPPDLDRPLRVRLYSKAPAELAKRVAGVVSVGADHLVADVSTTSVMSRGEPAAPRATFVIDYDAEPVAALRAELVERHGPAPANADLAAYVRSAIAPSNRRGFDIASQVASHKSGDCTEHAVLLTALARSLGLPARVAIGTVIARDGGSIGAFGHAWAEIYRDGAWSLVDATPIGANVVAYIPEGLIEEEGPGHAFAFFSLLTTGILRVEVIGNSP